MTASISDLGLGQATDRKAAGRRLIRAVGENKAFSPAGLSERLFAHLFKGLVYPQIWEDPEVDMQALRIDPGHHIVTIASGGCNALSYLITDPARIEAVDLNPAHIAFNRLKHAAVAGLPDYDTFFRFYGRADQRANIEAYRRWLRPRLDAQSRAYWDGRTLTGRRRISIFSRNLYRHGLLGLFIGLGHRAARLYGIDLGDLLKARTLDEQRVFFDTAIAPIFDRRLVRWATARKSSLFGLGIPPQQYDALASAGDGGMAAILKGRLEKLACGFLVSENYFAWQAFGRAYGEAGPLPPYLTRGNFETLRTRVNRLTVVNASFTELLAAKTGWVRRPLRPSRRTGLDERCAAQRSVARDLPHCRTRRPRHLPHCRRDQSSAGARRAHVLDRWEYAQEESRALHALDRSSIYGGFHLYMLKGA